MKNLAGDPFCDSQIVRELLYADIDIIPIDRSDSEVPASFMGYLNGWNFTRAWTYWVAQATTFGLSIEHAEELYTTNRDDVRAGGDCACRPPSLWSTHYELKTGKKVMIRPDDKTMEALKGTGWREDDYCIVDSLLDRPDLIQVVSTYHIDTIDGLYDFVKYIRD